MDLYLLLQLTLQGLAIGTIFALVSLGLSITFGKLGVINVAHVLFYTLGAYIVYTSSTIFNNFWLGILIGGVSCFILGVLNEILMRPLYGKSIEYTLIFTIGILYIGTDVIKRIWGVDYKAVSVPKELSWYVPLINMEFYRMLIPIISVILFVGVALFLRKTMLGKIIVAFIDNEEHLQALGINPRVATMLMFAIGSALAAFGGALHAPLYSPYPYMSGDMLLYAFATVVVGGLGSIIGTLVGGVILGIAYSYAGYVYPYLSPIVVFAALFIVLAIRPRGLLGYRL